MGKIAVYSTPTCHYCKDVKEFLKTNNLEYVEYNVASDLDKRAEMVKMSGQMGVPVTKVGNEIFVGFTNELKQALTK